MAVNIAHDDGGVKKISHGQIISRLHETPQSLKSFSRLSSLYLLIDVQTKTHTHVEEWTEYEISVCGLCQQ